MKPCIEHLLKRQILLLFQVFFFTISFSPNSNQFSRQLTGAGMLQNNTFISCLEKSILTDPDNYIIPIDWLNFQSGYNINKLSSTIEENWKSPGAFSWIQQYPAGQSLSSSPFRIFPVVKEHTSQLLLEIHFSLD